MTATHPPDSQLSGLLAWLPAAARPYALLARFDRPIGWWLLYWPCAFGVALGGGDALERLCEECAPAFAHVLWRLGCLETTFDEMERPLKEWVRGEEGWHRVFVQRIASEWGYLRMMKRMNTSIYAGEGVVYRNAKTGESIAFQRSQSIVDRH